jgi:hypothetical protein
MERLRGTPEQFSELVSSELAKWIGVVKRTRASGPTADGLEHSFRDRNPAAIAFS